MPQINDVDDVIIKVVATGVCGSDNSRYKKLGPYKEGMTFGHEFSDRVEATGSKVNHLQIGDAVTGCPAIVFHQCTQCENLDNSQIKKLGQSKEGMSFGHEFSGLVEAIGSKVNHLQIGDAVTGCPAIVCHQCAQCEKGDYSRCEHLFVIG